MAADVSITMEAQNKGVIQAMDQVGKKADQLNRKTQAMGGRGQRQGGYTQGMGVLEVSRAIEDAQYGIRGVLNNIPGIIQSFGGSMGLAGVVSIAAVAVSVLGKRLYDWATGAADAKAKTEAANKATERYAASIKKASDELEEANKKERDRSLLLKEAAANDEMIRRLGDPARSFDINSSSVNEGRSARDRLNALKQERDKLLGMEGITSTPNIQRDFEDDAEAANKLVSSLQRRQQEIERLSENVALGLNPSQIAVKISDLSGQIAFAEKQMEMLSYDATTAESKLKSTASFFADAVSKPFRYEPMDTEDPTSGLMLRDGIIEKNKQIKIQSQKQLEQAKAQLEVLNETKMKLEAANGSKQKELEVLSDEAKKNQDALAAAIEKEKSAKFLLDAKREELKIQKEIDSLQYGSTGLRGIPILGDVFAAMSDAKGGFADILNASNPAQFNRMNPSDMLSSSGRIGGSVKEYSSAVATVNYQRETLVQLKKIASNTGKGKPLTYA
jgi:hypothetical protein